MRLFARSSETESSVQENPPQNQTKKTYCRICEAHCGLAVTVSPDNEIISVKPDKDHPVSKGYACIKGTGAGALHSDPDRINYPMKRVNGELFRISWQQAINEIGEKVRSLRSMHGDRAIAMYQGNPTYFSFQNILYSSAFLESLGSPNIFASHSIDGNNKYEAATQMYGRSMIHPVADLENTQFFMCIGSNPVVSQMSIIQVLNPLQKFKAIEARGGKVVFVDPRRTETSSKVGEQVFIKPGTDVYLLLGMLHVIAHEHTLDLRAVKKVAKGVSRFVATGQDWTPERVAQITEIPADTIRRLALEYRDADGAALYMSTGVNMGPFGTLAYWLIQGLNLITGNTDKKGGLLLPRGAFDAVKLAELIGLGGFDEHQTLSGEWHRVAGCFPVSALADEILIDHPQKIRALFVSAGNPVHSVPDGKRIKQAMDELELIVSVDIYPNETSLQADYILPATDMMERSDYPASHMVLQETPHTQYTPEMVPPKFERKVEWEIFSELALACGAPVLGGSLCNALPHLNELAKRIPVLGCHLENGLIQPELLLSLLLRWGGKVTLEELKATPEGVLLGETEPDRFLGKCVPTEDGLVNLWPERLTKDLVRMESLAEEFETPKGQLRLIGQRQRRSHNSWMHNNPHIKQPDGNTALMNPLDAKKFNVQSGDRILIKVATKSLQETAMAQGLELPVELTEDVFTGVLVVPHGWGHQESELGQAKDLAGRNINEVIPGGVDNMEPASGQAIMLGHLVSVERAPDEDSPQREEVDSSVVDSSGIKSERVENARVESSGLESSGKKMAGREAGAGGPAKRKRFVDIIA